MRTPKSFIESELFGHVKGAFTGADRDRMGAFEAAGGGYVFLDEIGEIPLLQQAKLLRVLQERKVQRVGSFEERPCSFRMIAATHVDLRKAVAEKRFREDLYFRIARETIHVPPLRERLGDFPSLVYSILAKDVENRKITLTSDAMALLQSHRWPGNVRELVNVVERLASRCSEGVIREKDVCLIVPEVSAAISSRSSRVLIGRYGAQIINEEKARFEKAIIKAKGDRSQAATFLGISRATFFRKAKEFGLVTPRTRPRSQRENSHEIS